MLPPEAEPTKVPVPGRLTMGSVLGSVLGRVEGSVLPGSVLPGRVEGKVEGKVPPVATTPLKVILISSVSSVVEVVSDISTNWPEVSLMGRSTFSACEPVVLTSVTPEMASSSLAAKTIDPLKTIS